MATIRKLPSGLWQATVVLPVKTPSGRAKRVTKTDPLRKTVGDWATRMEAAISSGTWLDPKSAEITLSEWRKRWAASRIADSATAAKNESHWRNHVEPVWGGHPLGLITRGELKTWVARMHTETCPRCRQRPPISKAGMIGKHLRSTGKVCAGVGESPGLGPWTIQGAVAHLSAMLSAAADDGLIPANPAAGLKLPKTSKKPVFWWTRSEAAAIVHELGGIDALMVELNMHVGMRPGELLGLRREFVDTDVWQLWVYGVATRSGWRPYGKSSKSHRAVPVPVHLRERLLAHVADLGAGDLVYPAPGGGVWDDRNWSQRILEPAVKRAGVRRGTAYDTRHTAASWLVQAGVSLYKVQALLGHEKYSTTEGYAHLAPGVFDDVMGAWSSTGLDVRAQTLTAPGPHEGVGTVKDPGSSVRKPGSDLR